MSSPFSSPSASTIMIEELESKWSQNMGLQLFDKICQVIEDDELRQEAANMVASKIRTASIFRKSLILEELAQTSLMCRIYLSHEFRSVRDLHFPRMGIFYEKSPLIPTPMIVHAQSYITVFGKNAHFNLGISNDAKPVKEAKIMNFPQWRKIEMSNSHTLFSTHDGRAFGCGKSSLLTFGDEVMTEEYLKEPTMLKIPFDEFVEDILALKDGSIIVTDKFVHIVGQGLIEKIKRESRSALGNCEYRVLRGMEEKPARIVKPDSGVLLDFYIPNRQIFNENVAKLRIERGKTILVYPEKSNVAKYGFEMDLALSGGRVKVFIQNLADSLFYSFTADGPKDNKCLLVLHGKFVKNLKVVEFFGSPDGKVIMKLSSGVLVKGWVEVVRQKVGKNPECRNLIAIVNEIPGSYGVDIFCCSPDGENCIFQIGRTEQNLMRSFEDARHHIVKMRVIQDFRGFSIESGTVSDFFMTCKIIKRISRRCQTEYRQFSRKSPFVIVLTMFQELFVDLYGTNQNFGKNQLGGPEVKQINRRKCRRESFGVKIRPIPNMRDHILQKMQDTLILHTQFDFNFLANIEKGLEEHVRSRLYSVFMDVSVFAYFEVLAKLAEQYFNEETANDEQVDEIQMRFDIPCRMKSQNIEKIVSDRIEKGDLNPDDIPIDLQITVTPVPDGRTYLTGKTNQTIFELMHPNWARNIENGNFHFTDKWAYNYFYNRSDLLAVGEFHDWDSVFPDAFRKIVKITKKGEVLCRLVPKHPITKFITPTTSAQDIYYLESLDGNRIAVHRYLMMLQSSCLISAKQRFDLAFSNFSLDSEEFEPMVIKTFVTTKVIENSMKALLDMTTLFEKSIEDAVDVLQFFDFFGMKEGFEDTMAIIFEKLNDTNLDVLYWLFEKFEPDVAPHLLKHNRLILMSASEHIPPREFIKKFCKLLPNPSCTQKTGEDSEKIRHEVVLEAEDAMRLFIDLPADVEKPLLEAFEEEWGVDYEPVLSKRGLSLEGEKPPGNMRNRVTDFTSDEYFYGGDI